MCSTEKGQSKKKQNVEEDSTQALLDLSVTDKVFDNVINEEKMYKWILLL